MIDPCLDAPFFMPEFVDFFATLYFAERPALTPEALMAAWAAEGYTCETMAPHDMWMRLMRGRTAVYLEHPQPTDPENFPEGHAGLLDTGIDYDSTYLINPRAAFEDFQSSAFEANVWFRIVTEPGDDMRLWQNDFVGALLGIHQCAPVQAIWIDHLRLFVGKVDFDEYVSYRQTTDDMPPPSTPYPLMFGTLIERRGDGVRAWTTGLAEFDHPEFYIEEAALAPIDAARLLFLGEQPDPRHREAAQVRAGMHRIERHAARRPTRRACH